MRIVVILFIIASFLATVAEAQLMHGVTDSLSGGGTPTPPSCSNSLDFTKACNSQYMGIM